MKHIKTKTIIGSMLFCALFSAASVAAVRYDFSQQFDFRFPDAASDLFTGYYIFDEKLTPASDGNFGEYDNPIIEMGFTFQGYTSVFNTCLSASCSSITILDEIEEHYTVDATLLDSTGTRSASFGLISGDIFSDVDPGNIDILLALGGQYSSPSPAGFGSIGFSFETSDGQILSAGAGAWRIDRVGPVSVVPEPVSLLLMGVGLAGLGFSRKK
jgi:hypothetical protein